MDFSLLSLRRTNQQETPTATDAYNRVLSNWEGCEKRVLCSDKPHSTSQFGFIEGAFFNKTAVLLTEVLSDVKIHGNPIYVTYMDTSKAFDVVDRSSVLRHFCDRGVRGNLWRIMEWTASTQEVLQQSSGMA